MNKLRLFNKQTFLRAIIVAVIGLFACFVVGNVIKQIINALYESTDSNFWFWSFRLLSNNELLIYLVVCLIGIALCANWIFAPTFISFSGIIAQSFKIDDDGFSTLELPKSMASLEAELNDINKEIKLWKYAVLESEQRKNDLVAYLAHDIRTPLTSVLGYLGLLSESPELPSEHKQKYVGIALRKAERMQALVEELFEITRYNISNIEVEKTEVNANVMLNQLVEELTPILEKKQIRIVLDSSENTHIYVDPEKMARAVDNVLHNAANYTPSGGTISIGLHKEGERVCISIANTGRDIPQEKLDRFFEKFYRGDEARQSSGGGGGGGGGSGLGLAIAKSIIEAHGGNISARNQDGITTFTIII